MPVRARIALLGAGVSCLVLLIVWLLAFHTHLGAQADQSVFLGFAGLQRPKVDSLANLVAHLCDPVPFVILAAAVVLVGANATTEALKPLLAQTHAHWMIPPGIPIFAGSWPSGHATAAMSLALSLVLVAPSRWRPAVAALGALFAVAVCYSFL